MKRCEHCGRQFVSNDVSDKYCVSSKNAVRLFSGYCCFECNDFDSNGLLPGEVGYFSKNF